VEFSVHPLHILYALLDSGGRSISFFKSILDKFGDEPVRGVDQLIAIRMLIAPITQLEDALGKRIGILSTTHQILDDLPFDDASLIVIRQARNQQHAMVSS
jgi:hypothetical protein